MASEAAADAAIATDTTTSTVAEDMELENPQPASNVEDDSNSKPPNGDSNPKRGMEALSEEAEEENGPVCKKPTVEKSVEEERLQNLEVPVPEVQAEDKDKDKDKPRGPVSLGPKTFSSSVEMFDYFYAFLHHWPISLNLNKYEHMVLLDLLKQGHQEPERKIGPGINAFQIRNHPVWKSRCFFAIRTDESEDDFSFRKCVDNVLPLPEHLKPKSEVNRALGGRGHGGGNRGGWGGGGGGGGHRGKGGGGGRRGRGGGGHRGRGDRSRR